MTRNSSFLKKLLEIPLIVCHLMKIRWLLTVTSLAFNIRKRHQLVGANILSKNPQLLSTGKFCLSSGSISCSTMHTINKASEDKREYRGLKLDNGMKVILVSDPSTDKAAAALDVNVGYEFLST